MLEYCKEYLLLIRNPFHTNIKRSYHLYVSKDVLKLQALGRGIVQSPDRLRLSALYNPAKIDYTQICLRLTFSSTSISFSFGLLFRTENPSIFKTRINPTTHKCFLYIFGSYTKAKKQKDLLLFNSSRPSEIVLNI